MDLKELETMLQGTVTKAIGDAVAPINDRLEKLEQVKPAEIHTKGNIHDDGYLAQVGANQFRLPGGSVVNTSSIWETTGKGFKRHDGIFEKLGEEAEEFFVTMKGALFGGKGSGNFKVQTKSVDITTVMRSEDDSSAGLFVPEDVRYALLQFAPPGTIVWPRAQVWPMTTDNIQWPKLKQDLTAGSEEFFGNVELTWTEEGRPKTTTRPEFGMLSLTCHELSAFTPVTDTLLQDSAINIGNLLVQLFQAAYWHYTDKVFIDGMGGTRPMGILNAPGINVQSRITAGRVGYRDLLNMSSTLPSMFDSNACWMMKKQVFNTLRKEVDENGRPVIDLGHGYNNFGEGIAGYILGYPVVISDFKTPALGSKGDVILGDWKHYFIGERKTIAIEMSRHYLFQDNQTAFRATARLGGTPEQEKAFVVLDSTADASLT